MYRTDIHCISVWYRNVYRSDGLSMRMHFDAESLNGIDMSLENVVEFIDMRYGDPLAFIAYDRRGCIVWNMSMTEAKSIIERMNINE